MKKNFSLSLYAALLLGASCLPSSGALPKAYRLTSIGMPTAGISHAYDVNSSGTVVGYDMGGALTWSNGKKTYLPSLAGASSSRAYCINDQGVVGGESDAGKCTIWTNGVAAPGPSPWLGGRCVDINNKGELAIVGNESPGVNDEAYRYSEGILANLDMNTPVINWDALYINDNRELAGYGWDNVTGMKPGNMYAYYWSTASQRTRLPFEIVMGINNLGQVIGYNYSNSGYSLWQNGQVRSLGNVLPRAINNQGQIVGCLNGMLEGPAVIWENDIATNLNSRIAGNTTVKLTDCIAITDNGYILARSIWDYYLLTPVPEPSTILPLILGSSVLGFRVLRSRRK